MRRHSGGAFAGTKGILFHDLHRRIRVQPVRRTIHFLVDASDSMLVEEQMKLAKGAVLGLLTQAYQKRYRVGVVVFHHWHAHEVLAPTTSITLARQALQAVATGGGTPLAEGLHTVLQIIRSERVRHPHDHPELILITDGKPSVTMNPKAELYQEVLDLARQFPLHHIPSIVLSTVEPGEVLKELAFQLKAPLHKLRDVINSDE
jgi:magnesium chelatase subunit D